MSDPYAQKPGRNAPSPLAVQMLDPKFASLSYEEQQYERASLYVKTVEKNPDWVKTPADQQAQAIGAARNAYPPAFVDTRYENFRVDLESNPSQRLVYTTGVQMGMTGLGTRGVVNTARAFNNTLSNVEGRVGRFFGATPPQQSEKDLATDLLVRAIGGDKDGVKLAQYLQGKYEKPINPRIPLIGGQTPTQLLGSSLGFGTDLLTMSGPAKTAEGLIQGATALAKPVVATVTRLAGRAAIAGTSGVVRGEAAGMVNSAKPQTAPVEGAVDFNNGVASTVKSVGTLWGMWAAQDLAFGMLGQGAAEGISRVGKSVLRSTIGRGTQALPNVKAFEQTVEGEFTPQAKALQDRFVAGNVAPEARAQLGPIARDWAESFKEAIDYSKANPNAIADNPVAAWRVSNQLMMGGRNSPLGIATIEDGAGTWRVRQAPGHGGEVLGEHLSFPEAEMVTHGQWERAIETSRTNYDEWNAKYERTHSEEAMRQVQSFLLRKEALQDSFPHDRVIRDSLANIQGNMDRFAPEGAARRPSAGAMLTYGEVGQVQDAGMKVAKIRAGLAPESMGDVAKRGSLIDSDKPARFTTVAGGEYNGAIIYSRGAPENVYQVALTKADEFMKAGAHASREDLAQWYLRDQGFDAIEHQGGDVTALYPRQQVKAVSDMVNKSSREFTTPQARPSSGVIPSAQVDELLAKAREAHGEISLPGKASNWAEATTVQDGRPTLWYNDAQGGTHAVFADRPTSYKAPSMLGTERDRLDWLTEVAGREGGTQIGKTPSGDYVLQMKGQAPVQGDLKAVTDEFLLRSTSPAHLRASLEAEGMGLKVEKGQYSIQDMEGKTIGSGASVVEAMTNARYRPRLLDGRFGPKNIEVLPEGSRFEYSPQGIRGSLSDVYKYAGHFMDVAEAEGKTLIDATKTGRLSQGHDGAYSVEIPSWGIREKFGSLEDAKDYLGGKYKEYDNIQRLANERGFAFSYETGKGYVLSGSTGTYAVHSIDDVGKILGKSPDPDWAPGGRYDAGVTMKDSADAVKLPSDTSPNNRNTGKTYYDRGAIGKSLSQLKTWVADTFGPARGAFARAEREYGIKGLSKLFDDAVEGVRTGANQTYLDAMKSNAMLEGYHFTGHDLVVVDKVMSAVDGEARDRVFEDFGVKEGDPKRPQILDAAQRLSKEGYDKVFARTGQNPDYMLRSYAPKHREFKQANPQAYQDMELSGPDGMRSLIQRTNGGRVPDDMRFAALHERVSDVDAVLKEENAHAKFVFYSQMANRWAYAAEPLKALVERLHKPDVPEHIRVLGEHYIDQAMNAGQSDAQEILRSLGQEGSTSPKRSAISFLQTAAGMGTYGFKPASSLHILANTYTLGSAHLGTEAMNQGFRMSSEGGLPHLEEQFQKGVFTGRAPILYGFGDTSLGQGWLASLFNKAAKASSFFVQNGHILAKSASYDAASWVFDRHIKPWVDGGKLGDWETKAHDIRSYLLDPGAQDAIEAHLNAGDYAAAKHAYAMNMTDKITFTWRPEDQGVALNTGVLGRMYGQLMVLPTQYASSLSRLAGAGSFADRVVNLATFAKNTAALYGAERAAGMSGSNLLPWNVITLRGGPLWQTMTQLTSQQPGSNALKNAEKALATLTPGVPQVAQAIRVIKEVQANQPWAAFLTLTGASVLPDLRPPK